MSIKVDKFGGSSLANAVQFQKVKSIVTADKSRRYVVPSAPGKRNAKDIKITDLLLRCQRAAAAGQGIDEPWSMIRERYLGIVQDLGLSIDITGALDEVQAAIAKGCTTDYAASRGEYLCGVLLSKYLGYDFLDPASFLKFDAQGNWDEDATRAAFAGVSLPERAVIPGFYGSYADGSICIFSRGGSDVTGAIVAMLANADVYENWTDVSGVCMADPRIVDDPGIIDYITYAELRELAYMGASVVHEDAIFPVRKARIPINVRNTNAPEQPGTMIVYKLPQNVSPGPITGIAGRKGFAVIAVEKDRMNTEHGFGRKVLGVLEDFNISFEHMPTGIDTLSVVVEHKSIIHQERQILRAIHDAVQPDVLYIQGDIAILAVVGQGMVRQVGIAAKVFDALARENINIRMIDQGSSEINILIGVEEMDLSRAIKAIYTEIMQH